jgi:predicted RNA-binding protein YlqC (UPF0109 family)
MEAPIETQSDRMKFSEEALRLIQTIAEHLVDQPDKVTCTLSLGEQTTVITVKSDRNDIGKLIGKQGRMANSLREILKSVSAKNKIRMILEISDDLPLTGKSNG